MRKSIIITERLRGAWAALRAKPYNMATVEIGMRHCDECDYYKAAHEPAVTAQEARSTEGPRYYHEIEYRENRVLVKFYETTEAGPVEIARSYGHIRSEGAEGVAQATSYAMSLIWYQMTK